eukprot:scaffold101295_cov58-Attheya_sp.AAC.3
MTGTIRNVWCVVLLVLVLFSSHVANVLAKKHIFSHLLRRGDKEGDANTLLEQRKPWWRRRGNSRQEGRFRKRNASEDIQNHGSSQKFFKRRSQVVRPSFSLVDACFDGGGFAKMMSRPHTAWPCCQPWHIGNLIVGPCRRESRDFVLSVIHTTPIIIYREQQHDNMQIP